MSARDRCQWCGALHTPQTWSASENAGVEAGPMLNWHEVHAVDVAGDTIGHAWRSVEGVALDLGLMVRVPHAEADDRPPPGFITLVPWHQVAWMRWQIPQPQV